jgi:3-oxoacyl-[acyl-carrier-protein] synthase II
MTEVFVMDTAIVTAMGGSVGSTWTALLAGESAVRPIRRFETGRLNFHNVAWVEDLAWNGENAVCALMGKALGHFKGIPTDTRVIWTGIKGNSQYVENGPGGGDGAQIYLPHHYRQWVCRHLGLPDEGLEVNAACASSTVGMALGTQMIADGECASVLVCCADVVSRFIFTGFSALRGLSAGVCRPFDLAGDGLCLGDGAAGVLLANQKTAGKMSGQPLARLTGWGIANDANHITGPAKNGSGLISAINSALGQAGVSPEAVEAFSPHGTGTPFNDGMELAAIESVFGSRRFPVFSVKGSIGHTLGAAGAVESAIAIRAMNEKIAPPTVGLINPEARAVGRACGAGQPFAGNNILKSNSGFGGCNAALIFERA